MTHKLIFLIPMLGLLCFSSCKNNASNSTANNPKPEVVEEEVIDEIPTASELDFDGALEAFKNKKYAISAKYIDDALKVIEAESKELDSATNEKVDLSVVELKRLSERIKKGEIKDFATLERAFSQAEMLMAHNYFVISDVYVVDNPKKSQKYTDSAFDKIGNAISKLKGEAKTEAESLRASIRESLRKGDAKTNRMGNAAGKKVKHWLAKHKIDI